MNTSLNKSSRLDALFISNQLFAEDWITITRSVILRYVEKVNKSLKRERWFNLRKKMVSVFSWNQNIRAQAYIAWENSSINQKNIIRTSSSILRKKDCKLQHLVDPPVLFISKTRPTSLNSLISAVIYFFLLHQI